MTADRMVGVTVVTQRRWNIIDHAAPGMTVIREFIFGTGLKSV